MLITLSNPSPTHPRGSTLSTNATLALAVFLTLWACHPLQASSANPTTQPGQPSALHFQTSPDPQTDQSLTLRGTDARRQILVNAELDNGTLRDFTHHVSYNVSPDGIVSVSNDGRVTPLGNGTTTLTATSPNGLSASLPVTVSDFEVLNPISFPNKIVPIFTKAGCNSGGCHGKSSGQNGFRLSLLGFEPKEDWEHLVKEARGRRLFPAAPERSLLLLKADATLPHGGGKRLEQNSDDYRLLLRWIARGMPYGNDNDPTIARIEVFPTQRTMPLNADQQLVILAHYTDGSTEDVTRSALFESNDKEMAETDSLGRVSVFEQPGDVAVMVRYQAQVTVFRATLPLGAPVDTLPTPKNFIDELVFKHLKTVGMPPSDVCDDSTFIRRVTLEVAGRLPTPRETKTFLSNSDPAKREQWIDRLLTSSGYADYFANKWSALLRNKRSKPTYQRGNYAFHNWIRDSLFINKPYDQFAREIIAASGEISENPPVAWYREVTSPTAQLEDTAQLFLGLRLQCAQCHHHPFERWSQQDYYSYSAFFSRVGRKRGDYPDEEIIFHKRGTPSATNKKTGQSVQPAGLGAQPLDIDPSEDPRQALADWMSESDNQFFARALVNRYWKHFFGRGLVDPEDDMRETNPASNPELLDALAEHFIDHRYDLKNLVRTICNSQTYQLSAIPNQYNAIDKKNFSRYYPKRLTAEVLFDAVNHVTKSENRFDGLPAGTRAVQLPDNSFNSKSYFLTVFGRPDMASSCECERSQDASLAQCLHLLNAKDIQEKLASDTGRAALLANANANADTASDEDNINQLYNLAYSRNPNLEELKIATDYLQKKASQKDAEKDVAKLRREAYEDMVWALLNTKEFLFNH